MPLKVLTPEQEMALIREKYNHFSFERKVLGWFDTGSKYLNSVLGKRKLGIPWGKIVELYGENSHGKSVVSTYLASQAQKAGARIILFDAENSYSKAWYKRWGIDTNKVYIVQPYLGFFGGKKPRYDKKGKLANEPEISSANVLCDEVRGLIKKLYRDDPDLPILLIVDSVTALETDYEIEVDMEGSNMRSGAALAAFLSKVMKKWVTLFATHNVIGIVINQTRLKPGASKFEDPKYTPGGKATKFYAHVRAEIWRSAGGRIVVGTGKSKKQIGIKGKIKNIKNKVGGLENTKCSYKIYFKGRAEFGPEEAVKEDA